MTRSLIDQIDQLLPQTQCRDCEFDDCRSYATAVVDEQAAPNKCLPGGESTLDNIAITLGIDPEPFREAIRVNTKPIKVAKVREDECIGCTKCIQACPIDAIIGTAKHMHTIISDVCNGCGLCVPPCPVDCIDWLPSAQRSRDDIFAMANQSRSRYQLSQQRRQRNQDRDQAKHQQAKLQQQSNKDTLAARKRAIAEAMQRSRLNKSSL